jgi:hypothetical protein
MGKVLPDYFLNKLCDSFNILKRSKWVFARWMQACEPIQTNPADATETAIISSTEPTTEWAFDPYTTLLKSQPNIRVIH